MTSASLLEYMILVKCFPMLSSMVFIEDSDVCNKDIVIDQLQTYNTVLHAVIACMIHYTV